METRKRAWIYVRIDAPEDDSGALKAQERELTDYAEQLRLTVVGTSSDLGTEDFALRPGITETLLSAERGEFEILLVQSLSRLTPNLSDTLGLLRHLKKHGVIVLSPLQGNVTELAIGGCYDA
jgi:DNA invertase Pin-like site-specific DNA recombinase